MFTFSFAQVIVTAVWCYFEKWEDPPSWTGFSIIVTGRVYIARVDFPSGFWPARLSGLFILATQCNLFRVLNVFLKTTSFDDSMCREPAFWHAARASQVVKGTMLSFGNFVSNSHSLPPCCPAT